MIANMPKRVIHALDVRIHNRKRVALASNYSCYVKNINTVWRLLLLLLVFMVGCRSAVSDVVHMNIHVMGKRELT